MPWSGYLQQMALGYLLTVLIETTVLMVCLSPRHSWRVRLAAGTWLTACTYPIVWLVFPYCLAGQSYVVFVSVAEVFAAVAEALLFGLTFLRDRPRDPIATTRDLGTVGLANLTSFLVGLGLG